MQHFKTFTKLNSSSSSSLPFSELFCNVSGFTVLEGHDIDWTADCRTKPSLQKKDKRNITAISFSNMLQKNIALWLSRKLYIADLSYYKRFSFPCVSWLLEEAHTCVGKFMETVKRPGSVRKVLQWKSVSKGRPPLATSPDAHATMKTLHMLQSPAISSTIWENYKSQK